MAPGSSGVEIRVTDERGEYLSGVEIYSDPGHRSISYPPGDAWLLGETGSKGVFLLSSLSGSAPERLVIGRTGFIPRLLSHVEPGKSYEVVLESGHRLELSVRTTQGRPVEGYGIALALAVLSMDQVAPRDGGRSFFLLGTGQARPPALGVTDASGSLILDAVKPGQYRLQCNLFRAPLALREPIIDSLSVPSPPVELVVEEPCAAVVRFEGDAALVVKTGYGTETPPFRFSMDVGVNAAEDRAREALAKRFPQGDCWIWCGFPSGRGSSIAVYVYGRTGGWSRNEVHLRPTSAIEAPEVVSLRSGSTLQNARLDVILENADASVVDSIEELVLAGWGWRDKEFLIPMVLNEEREVPCGAFTIRPRPGFLPRRAFGRVEGFMSPGATMSVRIKLDGILRRYGLRVFLPAEEKPLSIQVSLRARDRTEIVAPRGNTYRFWSMSEAVPYTAMVEGWVPVQGEMVAGQGELDEEGAEVFTVSMERLYAGVGK